MIAIEHAAGPLEIELVLRGDAPGQRRQPVEIVAGGAILRRTGLQHRQLVQLVVDALLNPLRHPQRLETAAEGVDVALAIVLGDTELFLDDLELLAQEELALALLHLRVDLFADLVLQLGDLDLLAQQRQHLLHPIHDRQGLEHVLQLLALGGGDGCSEIGQRTRFVRAEAVEIALQLLAVEGVDGQQFLDAVDQRHRVGARFLRLGIDRLARIGDLHQVGRCLRQPAVNAKAPHPLSDELDLLFLGLVAMNLHRRADLREAAGVQFLHAHIAHERHAHHVMGGVGDALHRLLPALALDDQRLHLGGEERTVVDGKEIDPFRQIITGRDDGTGGSLRLGVASNGVLAGFEVVRGVAVVFAHHSP